MKRVLCRIFTDEYLLLGSASLDLLKQSGEILAGRIAYLELAPFNMLETRELSVLIFGTALFLSTFMYY